MLKSMTAAGPDPKFAVKMPKLDFTTWIGAGWRLTSLNGTVTLSNPTGVLFARIALICPADT